MRAPLVTTALAGMILLGLPAAASPSQAQPSVRTDEVCFTVHNDGDPQPSGVYGLRYSTGAPTASATAIVLVHGVSPAHEYWDLRPDFSIARNLAAAGYTVFSYDRLGWGRSVYHRPEGGRRLTVTGAQSMRHEIVGAVKTGSYGLPAAGGCAEPSEPAATAPPGIGTVVVIGTSAGGAIVSGYPGRFHDVAAAVQGVWSNQGFSSS